MLNSTMLHLFLLTAGEYLREFAEVAVLGFFLAGIINAVVDKQAVADRLGGKRLLAANALAATWGFLTPLCCCSAIPTALTLFRAGSRRGPSCAFLIAVPWFNWYGLTALIVFLGWRTGLMVSFSAVAVGFLGGVLIDTLGDRSPMQRFGGTISDACGDDACCGTVTFAPGPSSPSTLLDFSNPREKVRAAGRFTLDLLKELGPWMLAGVMLGAAAEVVIPKGLVGTYLGKASVLSLLAALVVASVFYTDSLATLPWVRALLDKGLGVGSGMVLLVAGVGTNISTLGPITRTMGSRTAIVYGASVVALTAILGYVLNRWV